MYQVIDNNGYLVDSFVSYNEALNLVEKMRNNGEYAAIDKANVFMD